MTTEEHLQKIKAKCVCLLAIAERRTPGKWARRGQTTFTPFGLVDVMGLGPFTGMSTIDESAFIASCAGNAEAGWRATIAVIDLCLDSDPSSQLYKTIDTLLTAWPEELL